MVCLRIGLCLIGAALCSRATTAVGIWTPEEVVLAVDSRVRTQVGLFPASFETKCKIVQVGSSYVALAGLIRSDRTDVMTEIGRAPVGGENAIFNETVIIVTVRKTLEFIVRTGRSSGVARQISARITYSGLWLARATSTPRQ